MRINSINTSMYSYKTSSSKKNFCLQNKTNVSYRGISSTLILLAMNDGVRSIKSKQKMQYIHDLNKYAMNGNSEEYLGAVKALSKTPDTYSDNLPFFATLFNDIPDSIYNIREKALYKLDNIPDNSRFNLQAKKDFMNSYIDNGHEIKKTYLTQFKILDDRFYQSFKEEIIDKVFYSSAYNQKRDTHVYEEVSPGNGKPFYAMMQALQNHPEPPNYREKQAHVVLYNNLRLLSMLDCDTHRDFIAKRRGYINKMKSQLENYFNKAIQKIQDPYAYREIVKPFLEHYNKEIKNL